VTSSQAIGVFEQADKVKTVDKAINRESFIVVIFTYLLKHVMKL
jgi:hypothetical protein